MYKNTRDLLGKRLITDMYIDNAATFANVSSKNDSILKEIFEELNISNPYKVDLSIHSIMNDYFKKLGPSFTPTNHSEGPIHCTDGICDGFGIVDASIYKNGYRSDYIFECTCPLGYRKGLEKWMTSLIARGFVIDETKIYSKSRSDIKYLSAGDSQECPF